MLFKRIQNIYDVVSWRLCTGCGACYYYCDKNAVLLKNIDDVGIRPVFDRKSCDSCAECLEFCPGYFINAKVIDTQQNSNEAHPHLIGPYLNIMEGFSKDMEIRDHAASGGILTSLAQYCLEVEKTNLVLHTGSDINNPLSNITVASKTRKDLLLNASSRYSPSSPCDSLEIIENSDGKCVFIGKPCDVAALQQLRRIKPELNEKIGLVLSFFCAGVPSVTGTKQLLEKWDFHSNKVQSIVYRGKGWPGRFIARSTDRSLFLSYMESWGSVAKYRPLRCMLCPDGLGELADITCGDAWHRYMKDENPGVSLIIARTSLGLKTLKGAISKGYIHCEISDSNKVLEGQLLVNRKKEILGRLRVLRSMGIPSPSYIGYSLQQAWDENSPRKKFKTILGTVKRVFTKGLWKKSRFSI